MGFGKWLYKAKVIRQPPNCGLLKKMWETLKPMVIWGFFAVTHIVTHRLWKKETSVCRKKSCFYRFCWWETVGKWVVTHRENMWLWVNLWETRISGNICKTLTFFINLPTVFREILWVNRKVTHISKEYLWVKNNIWEILAFKTKFDIM